MFPKLKEIILYIQTKKFYVLVTNQSLLEQLGICRLWGSFSIPFSFDQLFINYIFAVGHIATVVNLQDLSKSAFFKNWRVSSFEIKINI